MSGPGDVDLDDTARCPVDSSCFSCRGVADLAARTVTSSVGVFCITLCAFCFQEEQLPRFSPASAVRATLEHCGHLGIDADQMSAAMRQA